MTAWLLSKRRFCINIWGLRISLQHFFFLRKLSWVKVRRCKDGWCAACSVTTVAAPVIWEEADFGLPGRKDPLQAGLLWRVAHVLDNPLQQLQKGTGRYGGETINIQHNHLVFMCHTVHAHLLISAAKVSLVPFKYLTESHFVFPRIHHTGVVVLQEGLSSRSKLAVNILMKHV